MNVSSKLFYVSLVVLIIGTIFFIFVGNSEASTISFGCSAAGQGTYRCVGKAPSELICSSITLNGQESNCKEVCKNKLGGDPARFGTPPPDGQLKWFCCNARETGTCTILGEKITITKVQEPIDLVNPPDCEPDQKKPSKKCVDGTIQSVDDCGVYRTDEIGAPCQETTPSPGTNAPYKKLSDQKLQNEWPNSPMGTSLDGESTLPTLIQYLYEWGIALGGLAAFIALLIAGIQYLTSFGDPISMKDALSRIQSAFFGLILLLSSWLILNTINPDLTTFRPLIVPPPTEGLGVCENEAAGYCKRFGDDFKCFEGFCAFDLESRLEMIPCATALVDGETIYADGNHYPVDIKAGDEFSVASYSDVGKGGCMGYLELYPRKNSFGTDCGGNKQIILLTGIASIEEAGDTSITCAKLRKIEVGF